MAGKSVPILTTDDYKGTWRIILTAGNKTPTRVEITPVSESKADIILTYDTKEGSTTYQAEIHNEMLRFPSDEGVEWHGQIALYVCTDGTRFLYAGCFFDDPKEAGIWGAEEEEQQP